MANKVSYANLKLKVDNSKLMILKEIKLKYYNIYQ